MWFPFWILLARSKQLESFRNNKRMRFHSLSERKRSLFAPPPRPFSFSPSLVKSICTCRLDCVFRIVAMDDGSAFPMKSLLSTDRVNVTHSHTPKRWPKHIFKFNIDIHTQNQMLFTLNILNVLRHFLSFCSPNRTPRFVDIDRFIFYLFKKFMFFVVSSSAISWPNELKGKYRIRRGLNTSRTMNEIY